MSSAERSVPEALPVSLQQRLVRAWYADSWWLKSLLPFSWLFNLLARWRRARLQTRYQGAAFAVPVIIVGNISVGGSGKTPLIVALAKALAERGIKVGVVSRGYGGHANHYPLDVTPETNVEASGDEPLLIALELAHLQCPVVVAPDRVAAVTKLLADHEVDLVLSDDGLQHYRLHRDVEIALIDGSRGLGNGRTLPAGPLRESPERLREVDFVVVNGAFSLGSGPSTTATGPSTKATGASTLANIKPDTHIHLQPSVFRHLGSNTSIVAKDWAEAKSVHAVAAIGNPERFRTTLESLGLAVTLHGKDDHQALVPADLIFDDEQPVIITAKDAVKLNGIPRNNLWVLEVEIPLENDFIDQLIGSAGLTERAEQTTTGS